MKDPYKEKLRNLCKIARRGDYNPSIFRLFDVYHPDMAEWDNYLLSSSKWDEYHNYRNRWVEKLAGHWPVGGSPPSWYRRDANRLLRARQKHALRKAIENDNLEDFSELSHKRTIRYDWY